MNDIKFLKTIQNEINKSKYYSHCKIEKIAKWELQKNNNKIKVKNINIKTKNKYDNTTIIYFHYYNKKCVYIGSTINLPNRLNCISGSGQFTNNIGNIPKSNGGKNKDTLIKFFKFLKNKNNNITTYAIAFHLYKKQKEKNIFDKITKTPLKEQMEYAIKKIFIQKQKHKLLLNEGLNSKVAYG